MQLIYTRVVFTIRINENDLQQVAWTENLTWGTNIYWDASVPASDREIRRILPTTPSPNGNNKKLANKTKTYRQRNSHSTDGHHFRCGRKWPSGQVLGLTQRLPWALSAALWGMATALWGMATAMWGMATTMWGMATAMWGMATAMWGMATAMWGMVRSLDCCGSETLLASAQTPKGITPITYRKKQRQ